MIEIICGNNLEVLREMEDCSVDSIVTDPPYGLSKEPDALLMLTAWINEGHYDHKGKGFMGKEWDAFVPQPIFWRECLRVLKPGGHLASFGGTRTFDLITLGLRLAGFEIRDVLSWNYGSGFPKSLDISKSIDKQKGLKREKTGEYINPDGTTRTWERQKIERNVLQNIVGTTGKNNRDITAPASPEAKQYDGFGTALKPAHEDIIIAVKKQNLSGFADVLVRKIHSQICLYFSSAKDAGANPKSSRAEQSAGLDSALWNAVKGCNTLGDLFGATDMLRSEWETNTNLSTAFLWLNILGDLLQAESTFTTEMNSALTTDLQILNSLLSPNTLKNITRAETFQSGGDLNALHARDIFRGMQSKLKITHTISVQDPATSKGEKPNSHLSHIIIARKPISEKNIAENVLRWGTGGLNLKACRIDVDWETDPTRRGWQGKKANFNGWDYKGTLDEPKEYNPDGRFPPNVIFDSHTAELLDEQSGVPTTGGSPSNHNGKYTNHGIFRQGKERVISGVCIQNDSGGASRFFPVIDFDVEIDTPFFYEGKAQTKERNAGVRNAGVGALRDGGRESIPRGNYHPTVKPVRLMEWLVKLITPIDGIVLEPYLGSGTTAVACKRLGYSCIGIEMNEEYVEIAKKRVDAVPESLFDEPKEKKLRKQAEQIAIQM